MGHKVERGHREHQLGAYGFRLVPADGGELPDLVEVSPGAEAVVLEWRHASALHDSEVVRDDGLEMSLRQWGRMELTRMPPRVVCSLPEPATPAAVVHPLSTVPLAYLSHWRNRVTLHGGAFLHNGRAWLVVGEQMAGKSSTLVGLALRGVPILADDLIVIEDRQVLSGPSCVDLRPDVAARIEGARPLGAVMGRERFRLSTPAGPARVPVGGLFVLEWSAEHSGARFVDMPLGDRLKVLYQQHYAGPIGPPHQGPVFDMLEVPAYYLRRAPDWTGIDAVLDQLLARAA